MVADKKITDTVACQTDTTILDKTLASKTALAKLDLNKTAFNQADFNGVIADKICIIGLGLIGSSVLQGIYDKGFGKTLVAMDKNSNTRAKAYQSGLLSQIYDNVCEAVAGADLIIIATPTQAVKPVLSAIKTAIETGQLSDEVVITDVASTKTNVIADAQAVFGFMPARFVPAHPIAGAEKSGFDAKDAKLFCHHQVIICPNANTDNKALQMVSQLWRGLGAQPTLMDSDRHDRVLAYTSHLPHLLAYALTYQLARHQDNLDIFRYAAGGFRDFSRIAASDPTMWHDIFLANQSAILQALDEYEQCLGYLRQLISQPMDSSQATNGNPSTNNQPTDNNQPINDTPLAKPPIDDNKSDGKPNVLVVSDKPNSSKLNSSPLKNVLSVAQAARTHFGYMLINKAIKDNPMQSFVVQPSFAVTGNIRVASDKSISHRAIMFGSLADGVTTIHHFLDGEDALSTLNAFRAMGVPIRQEGDTVCIEGVGIDGLSAPKDALDMGNSGTSMRLLAGILAAAAFDSVLIGDVSLSKRPMERVATPLRLMGASIQSTGKKGTAPLAITGGQPLQGIDYLLPVASAQVKSCLLLAGLFAQGTTTIIEPEISRDHTERMLEAFGYPLQRHGNNVSIVGGGRLTACHIDVPADISSAAFFMVATLISRAGHITLKDVGVNPTRTGVIEILRLMGGAIDLDNERIIGGEPVADITVVASNLHGIDIPPYLVPLAIDEFPAIFIAASCAVGQTKLTHAKELRVKESDRIQVMADGLTSLGINCTVLPDGMIIDGKGAIKAKDNNKTAEGDYQTDHQSDDINNDGEAIFTGGIIDAHHDHRIAMSFAIASVRADGPIIINGTQTVNTSFPNFVALANEVGFAIDVQ